PTSTINGLARAAGACCWDSLRDDSGPTERGTRHGAGAGQFVEDPGEVRATSGLFRGRKAGAIRRPGPPGENPLLLLRPAVWHPAQGEEQSGHWLRALGRVSLQPGHA